MINRMRPIYAALPLFLLSCFVDPSSSLDSAFKNLGVSSSRPVLNRKRETSTKKDDKNGTVTNYVMSAFDTVAETLEELWARESALAQKELERQLYGKVGSLPPVPVPVPSPVNIPSMAPTNDNCLNGRTPGQFLLDTLIEVTAADELLDPSTPQGQAFSFILNDTLVGADVCTYGTIEQRYGLGKCNYTGYRSKIVFCGTHELNSKNIFHTQPRTITPQTALCGTIIQIGCRPNRNANGLAYFAITKIEQ